MSVASVPSSLPSVAPFGNLPVPETRFIGRRRELDEIGRLLSGARLLTLIGPGGCGKTRLALQTAMEVQAGFADGVLWCDLAALSDPAQVPSRLAAELHLGEQSDRAPLDALTHALATRDLLIVLDNCEHVLAACASLAHALLRQCPRIKLLATSTQPLGLPNETVWQVPPLALPETDAEVDTFSQSDAVQLFVARARHASPSFALMSHNAHAVALVCRRLDGIPLAIELAAARVQVLSPVQIFERLDQAFCLLTHGLTDQLPRHQTLRATMDWSYALLTGAEQLLLRRLSIFPGSFTMEMAEAVCGDDKGRTTNDEGQTPIVILRQSGVLDRLTDLVDKSLVMIHERDAQGVVRFRLLETIRQYAREKLEDSGEAMRLRECLLEWAVAFVEAQQPQLTGPEAGAALTRLTQEEDNLHAALQAVRLGRAVERGLCLAALLCNYWLNRGALTEGRRWLEEFLAMEARPAVPVSPLVRAQALHAAGCLAFRQSDLARAHDLAEAALSEARTANEPTMLASALNLLAILATERGEWTRATALHERALAIHRQQNDLNRVATSLINLGILERRRGELRRAVALYAEALTLKRQFGDKLFIALTLLNLGETTVWQGEYTRAVAWLEESLLIYRELGNQTQIATTLNNLSAPLRYLGERERARLLIEEAISLHEQAGDKLRLNVAHINLGDLARDAGEWARAQTIYADALAQLRQVGERWSVALALYSLGLVFLQLGDTASALAHLSESLQVYHAIGFVVGIGLIEALEALCELDSRRGDWVHAVQGLGVAATRRAAIGAPIPPVDRLRYDQHVQRLRATVGAQTFARLQAEAGNISLEQWVTQRLRDLQPRPMSVSMAEPHLRVFALGPTRVLVGERVIAPSDWTYHKSKELFFYLLLNSPASKAQIGLDLWPEASAEQLRNIFHRTLHYVRQALGHPDWVAFADGAYTFVPAVSRWCDVIEFESMLAKARPLLNSGLPQPAERTRARQLLTDAIQLWRGDFLADMDVGEWVILRREALRAAYVQALMSLGHLHVADALYGEAVEVYRRVLAQDEYFEAAHRELMRCYARLGETSRALRHYQSLRQLLRDELAAAPSPETTLLYERLRRGDDV